MLRWRRMLKLSWVAKRTNVSILMQIQIKIRFASRQYMPTTCFIIFRPQKQRQSEKIDCSWKYRTLPKDGAVVHHLNGPVKLWNPHLLRLIWLLEKRWVKNRWKQTAVCSSCNPDADHDLQTWETDYREFRITNLYLKNDDHFGIPILQNLIFILLNLS